MKIEKCPFHNIEPEYKIRIFREKLEKPYISASGERLIMVLPRLADHYYYCPKCKNLVNLKERADVDYAENKLNYKKLAIGYRSQHSRAAALSNWNKAIAKIVLSIFKKAVTTGK